MSAKHPSPIFARFGDFLKAESASGIILMLAMIAAMICANSPLKHLYDLLLSTPVAVIIGPFSVAKPLLLWINDGLMAIFFFLVGLELKREILEGELREPAHIMLPAIGAIGGMLVPALIYLYLNHEDPIAIEGWAIPSATDIAFALGVLSLLGPRVPVTIKIFLTSLAIFDDLGAIIIIAIFYTSKISLEALLVVSVCIPILALMNRMNVLSRAAYIFVGTIMWVATLKSGVHATLAGVVLAMFIPMRSRARPEYSPVRDMESDLHSAVAFFILPLFAFANAGISLQGFHFSQLLHGVPLGIALGLFFGKQLGIFGLCWLSTQCKLTVLPKGMDWWSLYGTAAICGIGFTMSLFIGGLAFEESGVNTTFDERLGIILGSLLSGLYGFWILHWKLPKNGTSVRHKQSIT